MAFFSGIHSNFSGKGLTVSKLREALASLPDDCILAPNETTNNLSVYDTQWRSCGMVDFAAGDGDNVVELYIPLDVSE